MWFEHDDPVLHVLNHGVTVTAMPKPGPLEVSITIRFPSNLAARLRKQAKRDMRSINAYVVRAVQQVVEASTPPPIGAGPAGHGVA